MTINVLTVFALCIMVLGCSGHQKQEIRRFGQVAEIRPEMIEKYRELHAGVWPEVMEGLNKAHIGNYSIYLKELENGRYYLFGFYEYSGVDYETDCAEMLKNTKVREWENLAGGECLLDRSTDKSGVFWTDMEEVFYFEGRTDAAVDESKVERYGMVIGIRPEYIESYKLLHKHTWPEILDKIYEGNIRNYAIYLRELDGMCYLFSYFEYVGDDFEADMAGIDNDPATIAWMKFTDEICQIPLSTRAEGEWWASMENVFYYK